MRKQFVDRSFSVWQSAQGLCAAVFLALCSMLLAPCLPAQAQQTEKVPRIGFLLDVPPSTLSARIQAFRQGLRDLGYVEGKNIVIEWRDVNGKPDRLGDLQSSWCV
jgi:hypothetical protein